MPSDSGRPYLSEIIDYDTDIAPYPFIKINAGVGSGKNVFVDILVKGNVFRHSDGTPVINFPFDGKVSPMPLPKIEDAFLDLR